MHSRTVETDQEPWPCRLRMDGGRWSPGDPRRTEARTFHHFAPAVGVSNPRPNFKVNESQDEEAGYDVDAAPKTDLGAWEASGIVDASAAFRPGAFLVTVQVHSLWLEKQATATFTRKLEGGQLLLIRVPGG